MRATYVGPLDAVEIAATGDVVERGKSVEVDRELAEALAAQSDWKVPGVKTTDKDKEVSE